MFIPDYNLFNIVRRMIIWTWFKNNVIVIFKAWDSKSTLDESEFHDFVGYIKSFYVCRYIARGWKMGSKGLSTEDGYKKTKHSLKMGV